MNRFRIKPGCEETFLDVWRRRETFLDDVPGFRKFNLLQGPTTEQHTLFASHSEWDSRAAFEAWTESDAFRKAHAQPGASSDIYLGPPEFEGFEVKL